MVIILQILNEYTLADNSERAKRNQIENSELVGEIPPDENKNDVSTAETEKDKCFSEKTLPN